jgi:lysophospholipase L1-like esterase
MAKRREDNLMNRFDEAGLRRFRAREGVAAIIICAILLVIFQGPSILKAGHEMNSGIGRDAVLAVGKPSNWIARKLPFVEIASTGTTWLNPEPNLSGPGGFKNTKGLAAGQVPPVTTTAFRTEELGEAAPPKRRLRTLLVTGDSMSQPLDNDLAEDLVPKGVRVVREPHIGTGISTTFVVDWGTLSTQQVKKFHPSAVVVFIGANDGFPMEGPGGHDVACCGAAWAAIYANRVRQIMNTYRQAGAAHVYWITLPAPRDTARARIARVVNASISVAAQPWASQIQVINTVPIFTPGFAYRDAMSVDGKQEIVREADGIHLNEAGSSLLARYVQEDLKQNFMY